MPSSYVCSHFHIVFSTKNREHSIAESLQPRLWAYMAGIVKNHEMHALAIGGMDDHVHALLSLPGAMSVAKATQVLKANSSRWMNEGGVAPVLNGRRGILPAASAGPKSRG